LSDLAELTHWLTRLKLVEAAADDLAMSETERVRGQEMAAKLPIRVLSRTWQMLLKGLVEVQGSSRPIAAAEMVLVRIAYVSDGPGPEELIEQLKNGGALARGAPAPGGSGGGPRAQLRTVSNMSEPERQPMAAVAAPAQAVKLARFEDVIALLGEKRDIRLKAALETGVRLVRFEPGRIEIRLLDGAPGTLATELAERLKRWTGDLWVVSLSREEGAPTLREQAQTREDALKNEARADPLVKAAMAAFPGAEIVEVRDKLAEIDVPLALAGADDVPPDDDMELDT
jgi:DNA polymerase-3 subunit gamma/tau